MNENPTTLTDSSAEPASAPLDPVARALRRKRDRNKKPVQTPQHSNELVAPRFLNPLNFLDFDHWPKPIEKDPDVQVWRGLLTEDWDGCSPLGGLSLKDFERVLDHEGLWINGFPHGRRSLEQGTLKAKAGDTIAVYSFVTEPPNLSIMPQILFESPGVRAVLKPAGLSVGRTRAAFDRCLEHLVRCQWGEGWRAVHRLDRDTSGVILFANDGSETGALHKIFRAGLVEKRYIALVSPPPASDHFEVSGLMVRAKPKTSDPAPLYFEIWKGTEAPDKELDPKDSRTVFHVLARTADRALVEADLYTGRTHQIRVHLQSVGSPCMGDVLYSNTPAPRLMLHALWIKVSDQFEAAATP